MILPLRIQMVHWNSLSFKVDGESSAEWTYKGIERNMDAVSLSGFSKRNSDWDKHSLMMNEDIDFDADFCSDDDSSLELKEEVDKEGAAKHHAFNKVTNKGSNEGPHSGCECEDDDDDDDIIVEEDVIVSIIPAVVAPICNNTEVENGIGYASSGEDDTACSCFSCETKK